LAIFKRELILTNFAPALTSECLHSFAKID